MEPKMCPIHNVMMEWRDRQDGSGGWHSHQTTDQTYPAAKNGNRLQVDCSPDVGLMTTDLTKVRQVLFNLLSNAAKFTDRGDITLSVDHRAPQSGPVGGEAGWVRFRVSDTGVGVGREQMVRIFEAFTQGDASTTRKYGGTGLGLAISYRFCQLMGGDISVESEPGKGSTFTVHLPVQVTGRTPEIGPEREVSSPNMGFPPALD